MDETRALYERHGRVAHGIAYRVLRDHALAEDAVQEGLLSFWKTAERFDEGRGSERTWLCVLVHRRACDIARKEAARARADQRDDVPVDSYTAEEVAIADDETRRLRRAVTELKQPYREIVELAYWAGLSQSEVAERLDLPLGTVKSRTFEALRQLRGALAEAA
jgi:RNA polymerase sigma-70 factor, ECF subfamily